MKYNHLNVPSQWKGYWTRFPEGHTILEALIQWVSQVDSMVDNVNSWNEYLDNFVVTFDKELQQTVTDTLSDWQSTGFLDVVINDALQWQLDEHIAIAATKQELTNAVTPKADKIYTDEKLSLKRDKATKIKSSDLDTSADSNKIKQINLSEEVKQMMTGTTPINTEVATGGVTTEKLANDSVALSKVHQNILTGTILIDRTPPNYDTSTKVFDFNSKYNKAVVVWGNSIYSIPLDLTVVNDVTISSATKLIFNTVDKTFKFEVYNYNTTKDEILLAVIRTAGAYNSISANFPTTVNGVSFVNDSSITSSKRTTLGEQAILLPASYGAFPNLDTVNQTFSLPAPSVLLWRDKYKVISETLDIDLSTVLESTSAIKIYYDTSADTFKVLAYSVAPDESDVLICALRVPNIPTPNALPGVSINCEYTINGESIYSKGDSEGNDIVPNTLEAFVKGVAHRGYSATHPENTLIAYKEAKRLGYSYAEADVEWTSDGIPVLLHDGTIDRTSDGTGEVNTFTLEQLQDYDFGSWKGSQFTGETIPTFEDFIILCKKLSIHPYIEMKSAVDTTRANILVDIVRKYGMLKHCTWISFSKASLLEIKALLPNARLGFLGGLTSAHITSTLDLKTGTNEVFVFAYPYTSVTKELVLEAHNNDMEVETGTVNDKSLVHPLVEQGVSMIITDVLNIAEILQG